MKKGLNLKKIKNIAQMSILIGLLLLALVSCSSEKVKGVIVDASITISSTDPTKVNFMVNEGRYKNLYVQSEKGEAGVKQMPSALWESFKSEELVTRPGGAISVADMNEGIKKMEYCIISGEGKPISVGTEVYVIDNAKCTWVIRSAGKYIDGSSKIYNISLTKVKSLDGSQKGWIWSNAVK
jgi:hypothetical protein